MTQKSKSHLNKGSLTQCYLVNKDSLVESILKENIRSCVIPTGYLFYTYFNENCNIIISWLTQQLLKLLTSEQVFKRFAGKTSTFAKLFLKLLAKL